MIEIRRLSPVLALLIPFLAGAPLAADSLPRATPEEVGMSVERLGRLTEVLRDYVDTGRMAWRSWRDAAGSPTSRPSVTVIARRERRCGATDGAAVMREILKRIEVPIEFEPTAS